MSSRPAEDDTSGLTWAVGNAIIAALPTHPTRELACASCGKSWATVQNWLRRGQQHGAPPMLSEFAAAFLKYESDHASQLYMQYLELIATGVHGSARVLLEYMDRRWKVGQSSDVLGDISSAPKRTDDLRQMLLHPSPRLRAMLSETGWRREANWGQVHQLPAGHSEDGEDVE